MYVLKIGVKSLSTMVVSENDLCKKTICSVSWNRHSRCSIEAKQDSKRQKENEHFTQPIYIQHLFSTYAWRRQQLRIQGELEHE